MGFVHQTYALSRLIESRGQQATIYREVENEFHEPVGTQIIGDFRGLFHEANGYLGVSIVEAGKIYTAKQPMFLMAYTADIEKQDILEIAGRRFRVTGLDDLGNLGLFMDISLEVI
ncbi:hypothetical protein H8S37_12715 [Mediterraneibacter sp. NSJ-55]|uniref:Head-tail adaptor protein n=1 Tax=Mediterraneibacter hominis TaxID=2763054 RepID=A0A923LK63_9FIRM|nr:hypothetical protein [Mediterraneibacter hominis]MBC5689780.1 hypothetical protein [Mediterraneibacter hominis]